MLRNNNYNTTYNIPNMALYVCNGNRDRSIILKSFKLLSQNSLQMKSIIRQCIGEEPNKHSLRHLAPHLKSPKNQNRRADLGQPAIKMTGGGGWGLQLVCGRPTLALSSALVPPTLSCLVCVEDS